MFSRLAANDQHQTRRCAGSALRASRPAVVWCVDDTQDRLAVCKAGIVPLVTDRGRRDSGPFSRNSHRSRFLPLGVTGRRVFRGSFLLPENRGTRHIFRCALSRGARAHSRQASGSSPCRRNTLTHEQSIHSPAHVSHFSSLSKVSSSAVTQPDSKRGQKIGNISQVGAA